jgi:hypothetical protein
MTFHVHDRVVDRPQQLFRPPRINADMPPSSGPSRIEHRVFDQVGQVVHHIELPVQLLLAEWPGKDPLRLVDPAFQLLNLGHNVREVRRVTEAETNLVAQGVSQAVEFRSFALQGL